MKKDKYKVTEWMPLYDLIPKLSKLKFVKTMGYQFCHQFTKRHFISQDEYTMLERYVKGNDFKTDNTVLEHVDFNDNIEQVQQHYKALYNLMNGFEFQSFAPNDKMKLQSYQSHLFKQLN